ncbi:MAG TPA: RagB/SusD family nutrient uptake outer membrane protein [Gemmatimonadaceae bacterium]|nr:RagB/SusD family nutrient uptake outer membrane protein [Gemmatimonadaceae bacterium]
MGTVLTVASGALLYGCSDFLNKAATPEGALDEGTLATKGGVEGSLVAAYRQLDCTNIDGAWGCAVSNWAFGTTTSDDAYEGSQAGDQPPVEALELYHWSTGAAQSYLDQKWAAVYEGISRANATIRLVKKVAATGQLTPADARGIEGEALFLRAHYHFEAWRMWGNIPYYRETDTDFRKPNETSAQAGADIMKDLDSAIKLLPTTARNGDKGRATQWTAKAYKGRLQVYLGQWAAALVTLDSVHRFGPYKLTQTMDQVWTGFPAQENGAETIFAYQASSNDGDPTGVNSNTGERLNFPNGGSFTCCGFNQPSQNLANYYRVNAATGLPLALTDATWNDPDSNWTAARATARAQPFDPRVDWTIGRDSVPYKDWGIHQASWIRSPQHGGYYSPKKNVHEDASGSVSRSCGWTCTQLNGDNFHIFRYADLLLMLAEAEVEAGSLANAQILVDSIRIRAGRTAQGCGYTATNKVETIWPQCGANPAINKPADTRIAVPINDPSITWATYRIGLYSTQGAWTSQAVAREAVRAERRLELAMEGQRFFDLRRYGNAYAANVLNTYVGVEKRRHPQFTTAEAFTANHQLYPIPTSQIQISNGNLKQNPGW